ncbi:CNNM domain-containing protein [Rickettsiales bacterium LUAb2]
MWVYLTIIILLLIGSAFFSAAETALTSASNSLITAKAKKGNKAAKLITIMLQDKSTLIIVLLTLNNFINIFFSTLVTSFGIATFGSQYVFLIGLVNTIVILIIGEILPKTYAFSKPNQLSLLFSPIVYVIVKLCAPLTKIFIILNNMLLKILLKKPTAVDTSASIENLRGAIDLLQRPDEENELNQQKEMLNSLLDLYDMNINEIMIHRKNVFCVNVDLPTDELIENIMKSNYTKIPVYKNNSDNIIGVVYIKEVLRNYYYNRDDFNINSLIKQPIYFPETTSAFDLLLFFQESREKIIFVVDEYGGFMGIISIADVLEEIVGELRFRTTSEIYTSKNSYIINGDMTIRDLNRKLKLKLPDDNATTLAGLILYETGRIPNTGNIFSLHNFKFEIIEKKKQQIKRIKLTPLNQ